ncbi:MAG: right-handed parallel beta-helix repeat-containing protein [Promethearchaeota archaeon]
MSKFKKAKSKDLKKKTFKIFILYIIVFSTFLLSSYVTGSVQYIKKSKINYAKEDIEPSNGYLLVDPINLTSWSDWALYPFITGNGTDINPFVIENIEIIGIGPKTIQSGNRTELDFIDGGIYIDTNGSFIIRNCRISNTSIGIMISIGASKDFIHQITNVEITDCSIGIHSRWNIDVNISNCYIARCRWVSISAIINVNDFDFGGIGIRVRAAENSTIENCRIEDCSIGMMAEAVENIHNNELIRCGVVPGMMLTDYDTTNTVNGKPIGMIGGEDNLVFTQNDASNYGQLIFIGCANLTLSNIRINKPCSIGIQLYSVSLFQKTYLNNIICENQNLGFYLYGREIIANNLYAKNCKAGFYFCGSRVSEFSKIMTDDTDLPIYGMDLRNDITIEIEKSTEFYLADYLAWHDDMLQVESSSTSYNVSRSFITELGYDGYITQFDDVGTYKVSLFTSPPLPYSPEMVANFTVISVPRYPRPDTSEPIPSYPLIWLGFMIVLGFLLRIKSFRRVNRKLT